MDFRIEKKIKGGLGRAAVLTTPHGHIETPAFVTVGTKATVKALSPEQVKDLGAQVVLANTYHLYLQPCDAVVKKSGGLGKFMNWNGPTMTDSGGFQVFSLGAAYGKKITKLTVKPETETDSEVDLVAPAKIDEDGVTFKSPSDGKTHRFTPEKSIDIQNNLGADIIFAFDECTSPAAPYEYQKEALDRTHRWAKRSLDAHKAAKTNQALFGIVQGGRHKDLREESARVIGKMDFDGFGIGGSFDKEDMDKTVGWVNSTLPEDKPRHLLGIGEPLDLFGAVENGCDLFDCVAPTRIARNGTLYTKQGKINILNAKFKTAFVPIESDCECYTCKNYTESYLSHLFRAKEMFAATLASIHNLYFIVNLVKKMRQAILDGNFHDLKTQFSAIYKK
ncbi:tRNA guanosine(34) transglycosylase Tgt [Candidatus Parcubacteria bacterium]|nr:tRNA guanosine(34) transglycosylase Tgt [Candidatus Parcubacteria bacterium]